MSTLTAAHGAATTANDREHVTPWIYRQVARRFKAAANWPDTDFLGLKWSVDTAEDLEFVRAVYGELGADVFEWCDVIELLTRKPELLEINGQTWRPNE